MKESHEQVGNFPKEQVRSAIQAGISQAESQMNGNKVSYKYNHKISNKKKKGLYALSSVAVAFGLLVASSYQSPALASTLSQIPLIGSAFADSNSVGLILHGKRGETWYFSNPIKKIKDIKKVPIHHSQNVDGIGLNVKDLSVSKTGTSISYKSSEKGEDFELSRAGDIEFRVVDQDGNEVTGYSGGAEGEKVKDKLVFKSNKEFDPLNSHVTELTITPYLELPTDGGGVEYDENGGSKDIGFKGGSLKPVKFKSFKVKIPNISSDVYPYRNDEK
ncbi:DUF4179 domain-containing protein [Priestia megaterium]